MKESVGKGRFDPPYNHLANMDCLHRRTEQREHLKCDTVAVGLGINSLIDECVMDSDGAEEFAAA